MKIEACTIINCSLKKKNSHIINSHMIKYFSMTETNRIEYKRELTLELDIEKEVVAFLNYKESGW